jgi:hypothetical protein
MDTLEVIPQPQLGIEACFGTMDPEFLVVSILVDHGSTMPNG